MNASSISPPRLAIALLLGLVMAATRFHHFGSAVNLPDASLAVFFLTGFYLRPKLFFAALLAEAGLIDYLAINVGGVSDYCVSPAYWFLIPTYACLWYGGRWVAERHELTWRSLVPLIGALFMATSAAFLISNGSFYLLSGRFPDLNWTQYAARVAKYYPPYTLDTFAYVLLAAGLHVLVAKISAFRTGHSADSPGKH